MVVFLGRHLPALLEVFKKGEWVWLGGVVKGDSSLCQTHRLVGVKARKSDEVGVLGPRLAAV